MANQRHNAANEDHIADDPAGKGIQARVNTPSDPKTPGTKKPAEDEGRSRADDISESGDLAAVEAADKLKNGDQTKSDDGTN